VRRAAAAAVAELAIYTACMHGIDTAVAFVGSIVHDGRPAAHAVRRTHRYPIQVIRHGFLWHKFSRWHPLARFMAQRV
jgi:hypothetical protein